jgi:hypothetical protein
VLLSISCLFASRREECFINQIAREAAAHQSRDEGSGLNDQSERRDKVGAADRGPFCAAHEYRLNPVLAAQPPAPASTKVVNFNPPGQGRG